MEEVFESLETPFADVTRPDAVHLIVRDAERIQEAIKKAVLVERERCAKIAECGDGVSESLPGAEIAARIRKRTSSYPADRKPPTGWPERMNVGNTNFEIRVQTKDLLELSEKDFMARYLEPVITILRGIARHPDLPEGYKFLPDSFDMTLSTRV